MKDEEVFRILKREYNPLGIIDEDIRDVMMKDKKFVKMFKEMMVFSEKLIKQIREK